MFRGGYCRWGGSLLLFLCTFFQFYQSCGHSLHWFLIFWEENIVSGNQFLNSGYVDLNTGTAGFVVDNLTVTDNIFFSTGTARSIVLFSGSGSFANTGHTAIIKENQVDGMNNKTTELVQTLDVDANTLFSSSNGAETSDTIASALILPYDETPYIGFTPDKVRYSGGSAIPASTASGLVGVYFKDYNK